MHTHTHPKPREIQWGDSRYSAVSEKWPQTQKESWTVLRPLRYGADPRHEVISLGLAAFVLQADWQEGWLSKTIVRSVTATDVAQDIAGLQLENTHDDSLNLVWKQISNLEHGAYWVNVNYIPTHCKLGNGFTLLPCRPYLNMNYKVCESFNLCW